MARVDEARTRAWPQTRRSRLFQMQGAGFLAPATIVVFLLSIFPFVLTVVLSISNVSLVGGLQVQVGTLDHWARLVGDGQFWQTLANTLIFVGCSVIVEYVIGFLLALLLNQRLPGSAVFRVIFLIPMMLAPVAIAFMWRMIYDPSYGPLDNAIHDWLGLGTVPWLYNSRLALYSIIVVDIWEWTPFMLLLLLAGMQALPAEALEAARLDGAGFWQQVRYVILPMLGPISVMAILLRMIEAFKVFGRILILTGGGPGTSTESTTLYSYYTGLTQFDLGYGATLAIALFIVVLVMAMILRALATPITKEAQA